MTEKELLMQIMGLAYEITQLGKYEVFVNYQGHVNHIDLHYYTKPWKKTKRPKKIAFVEKATEPLLRNCISELQKLLEESKKEELINE